MTHMEINDANLLRPISRNGNRSAASFGIVRSLKHVLQNARLETEARGQSPIDEKSLLLALLREKDGLPARLLRRLHIDVEAWRTAVLSEDTVK